DELDSASGSRDGAGPLHRVAGSRADPGTLPGRRCLAYVGACRCRDRTPGQVRKPRGVLLARRWVVMKQATEVLRRAKNRAPLIRSTAREAVDRSGEIQRLEMELRRLLEGPGEPIREIRRVESELFRQRRGFEGIQSELARLGCSLDVD